MASSSDIARYQRELVPNDEICNCVPPLGVKLRISWTENYPARRFTRCPRSLVPGLDCRYFRWIDPELTSYYKRIVMYLKYQCGHGEIQSELDTVMESVETYKELWIESEEHAASLVYALNVKDEEHLLTTTMLQKEVGALKGKVKKQSCLIALLVTVLVAVVGVGLTRFI